MKEYRDAKGNLIKIGDKVMLISSVYYSKHINKIFICKANVLKLGGENIVCINVEGEDLFFLSSKFIKVDCFKNKIRKLKKLIKKD